MFKKKLGRDVPKLGRDVPKLGRDVPCLLGRDVPCFVCLFYVIILL